jgi:DNA-binding winged helix-turn-helix (wHTH) protein/Tol biopolymer transport system component
MAQPAIPPRIVRFGAFEFDPCTGELRKHGLRVRIQQQPCQVLLALLEYPGEVVSREDLVRRLWPDGTFVDFERGLNAAVTRLRQTLSDSAENPKYVQTVARRGYRFVSAVEPLMHHEPAERTASRPAPAAVVELKAGSGDRRSRFRRGLFGASLGIAIMLGILLAPPRSAMRDSSAGYVQITDFTDSAMAPVLSPDGRTLAFIRGADWFLSRGQLWLKSMPEGEPVQLTHDPRQKFAPAFSPEGSTLAYSVVEPSRTAWDTVVVPVLGGEPRLLMANAEGLTWLSRDRLLFSEIRTGIHMAVITSRVNRMDARDVYVPAHERAMAHFSFASPDRKWVLIIEMDHTTAWQPCRLAPLDGSSTGWHVGPAGKCTAAAWSPDGKWMFFTVETAGGDHLWRQRFPRGEPEQMTFGPARAQGVAVAPDGQSVITSLGMQQSAIWLHDSLGDRPISSVGNASVPQFSSDGKRVFYLLQRGASEPHNELWGVDVSTGRSERLVSGFQITGYDIADGGSEAVLAVRPAEGKSQLWLAPLDRRSSPVRIAGDGEDAPYFADKDHILFRKSDGTANYLFRMNRDGSQRAKVVPDPILNVMSVSPDGAWIATLVPVNDAQAKFAEVAIPAGGGAGKRVRICSGYCIARWAPDGTYLYVTVEPGATGAFPVPPGKMLPDLPSHGIRSLKEASALAGGLHIQETIAAPGLSPAVYAYVKTAMHRNLFRVPVP